MDLTQCDWSTYHRIPVTLEAMELRTPQVIETLEGPTKANEGDMIIRGIAGEHYLWHPERFAEHYELVDDTPPKTKPGMYARYQNRPVHIKAAPLKTRLDIETAYGTITGERDDMLIQRSVDGAADTDIYLCKPRVFSQLYERDYGMTCFEAFNPDVHIIDTLKDISLPAQGLKSFAFINSRFFRPSHVLWCLVAEDKVVVHREWRAAEKNHYEIKQAVLRYNDAEPKAHSLWCCHRALYDLRGVGLNVRCIADIVDEEIVSRKGNTRNEMLLERISNALETERLFITKNAYVGEEGYTSLSEDLQTYSYTLRIGTQTLGFALGISQHQDAKWI